MTDHPRNMGPTDYITPFRNLDRVPVLRREFVQPRDLMRDHDEGQYAQTWFLSDSRVAMWLLRRAFERTARDLGTITYQLKAAASARKSAEKAAE